MFGLDEVFKKLDAKGIMAKQNYWCCGGCGSSAMAQEVERLRKEGNTTYRGGTFFHYQGTESGAKLGKFYLNFGSSENKPTAEQNEAIGREVVEALTDGGFQTEWDGTSGDAILVILTRQQQQDYRDMDIERYEEE